MAPLLSVPVSAVSMLIDVTSSVMLSSIFNEALLDGRYFLASRWRLLMNRYLPLISGWLRALFCGCPSMSRSRPLSLLGCCHVELALHLISNAPCLRV